MKLKTPSDYLIVIAFTLSLGYAPLGFTKNNSDWVCVPTHNNLCGGYYQQPPYPYPLISPQEEAQLPFELSADETQMHLQGLSRFEGNVTVTHGNKRLRADKILLLRQETEVKNIQAYSNLVFTQPDIRIEGATGFWDVSNQFLTLNNIDYRYYPRHARGHAKKVELCQNNQLILTKGTYTTCAPCSNTWELSAQKLSLNKKTGRGQGQNMIFKVKDIPVFYWPYLDFPIDSKRHSGFLAPRASSTSNSGFEIALPFYWNIAPNYDYMLIPRFLSERGVDFQNYFRYLTPNASGGIQVNFLPNDKTYPQANPTSRFLLNIEHDHRFAKNWAGDIDFTYVGDNNYFVDLGQDINNAGITKLLQQVGLYYSTINWDHMLRLQQYQVLHPAGGPINRDDYRRQPQWAFHALYPQILGGLTTELDGEFTHFTHNKNPIDGNPLTIGQRYQLRPGLSLPIENPAGFFTPRIQLDFLQDNLNLSDADQALNKPSQLSRMIPLFDINAGLIFEKNYKSNQRSYRQTIEPLLYYLYVPYVNQNNYPNFDSGNINFSYYQEFRDNRFSGRDRVGDTNQLTTALTSRFYNANNEELIRINTGEIFYFADRKVTLDDPFHRPLTNAHSDLVANIGIYPNQNWSFSAGIEWNPDLKETNKSFVSFQYLPGIGKVINLDYYWMKCDPAQIHQQIGTRRALEQTDASFTWPLSTKLSLLGQLHYDWQEKRIVTMLAGIEHQSCCIAYQLVGSRYLKPNDGFSPATYENGLFFQIMFKGLTTLSLARADQTLATAIAGYTPFSKKIRRQQ